MKLFIPLTLLVLVLGVQIGTAQTLVAHTMLGSSNGISVTSNPTNTTGANVIFCAAIQDQSTTIPCTDSNSNTWTPLPAPAPYVPSNGPRTQWYIACSAIVGAGHTFTVTSVAGSPVVAMQAWSGITCPSALDSQSGFASNLDISPAQPGAITPVTGELILSTLAWNDPTATTATIDSGFTITDQIPSGASTNYAGAMAYLVAPSSSAVNPSWTHTGNFGMSTVQASFHVAIAGCGGFLNPQSAMFTAPSFGPGPTIPVVITVNPGLGVAWSVVNGGNAMTYSPASGTGSTLVSAVSNGSAFQFGPGSSSDTITFNSVPTGNCTFSVSNTILPRQKIFLTNNLGLVDTAIPTSTQSGAWAGPGNDQVPFAFDGGLPGGTYNLGVRGSSFINSWNTPIKTCSDTGYTNNYASLRAMNNDNSIIWAEGPGGGINVIKFPSCVALPLTISPGPGISTDSCRWMPPKFNLPSNVCFYFNANIVYKATINTTTGVTASVPFYTYPSGTAVVSNAGTADIKDGGYLAFFTTTDAAGSTAHPNICLLNMVTAVAACIDMSINWPTVGTGASNVNYVDSSSDFDSRSGRMYVWVAADSEYTGPRYYLTSGGSLTFSDFWSISPEASAYYLPFSAPNLICDTNCRTHNAGVNTLAHSDSVSDPNGHQYYINGGITSQFSNTINPFHEGLGVLDLDAPLATATLSNQVAGGGFSMAWPLAGSGNTNIGCQNGWCITTSKLFDPATGEAGLLSCLITAATGSGTVTLTLQGMCNVPFVTGDPVYVASATGTGCAINGAYASVGTVSGLSVILPSVSCGTYTGNGSIYKNVYPPLNISYAQEVVAFRMGPNGQIIEQHRLGRTQGIAFVNNNTAEDYWENGFCNLSWDHQWAVCNSNGGINDQRRIIVMATGIPPPWAGSGSASSSGMGSGSGAQ